MSDKTWDLCLYRLKNAEDTLETAKLCMENKRYRDTINRSYYAVFYAVKAVLALEGKDFKRHKDAVAYFNQTYVATEMFPREIGKGLGRLKRKREVSDYDDFYMISSEEASEQFESAKKIVEQVREYINDKKNH